MPYYYLPRGCPPPPPKPTLVDAVIKLNKIRAEIRLKEFEVIINELQRINNRTRKIKKD